MLAADIRFYLAIFLRWLPAALLLSCLTGVAGILIAFSLPQTYTSTATIVVETPDLPVDLARPTVPQNAIAQVELIRERLLTDRALLAMIRELRLFNGVGEPPDEFIRGVRDDTRVDQIGFGAGEQIVHGFAISFSAATPETAALVANAFAAKILADDLEHRQQRAADTLAFFQDDVAKLGQALKASEAELLAFRNDNFSALPESLEFRREQIADAQASLFALQVEEATARLRRASLLTAMRTTGQTESGALTPEASTLVELKKALAAQQAIFTEDSASIVNLKARIEALEDALPALAQQDNPAAPMPGEIGEIDARLREIAREKEALARSRSALEASLLATPANETSLRTMELERDNVELQYNAAVARLAEASTGERVQSLLKGERLTLFEEALPPLYPERPQRRVIVLLGAVAGFAIVMGLALVAELLNSRIRRPSDLRRRLSIQPLGVVPYDKGGWGRLQRAPQRASEGDEQMSGTLSISGRPTWTI